MIIRMIKRAIIRRRMRKILRSIFGNGRVVTHSRKLSMDKLPGYRPHTIMVGWWVEGDDLFRERIKKEIAQNAKR